MASPHESLWEKALHLLSDEDKKGVDFDQHDELGILKEVLTSVKEKQQVCVQKGWKIRRRNGQSVPLRDIFDRMIKWVYKFRSVGDTIIQYDPGHAALPWAAVRFLLQVAINDSETYSAMIEGVEKATSVITRYAVIEQHFLSERSSLFQQMSEAIIQVYVATLAYLSKAGRYYARNTASRIARSIVQVNGSAVQEALQKISDAENKVEELARLADSESAMSLQEAIDSVDYKLNTFSSEFDGVNKKLDAIQTTLLEKAVAGENERKNLVTWLGATFPDEEYEDALSLKVEGTCSWFLEKGVFRNWCHAQPQENVPRILWIHGAAGFGKSILSASLIQYLQQNATVPICFFFCVAQDEIKQKPMSILRSWIAQLINQDELASQLVQETFMSKDIRSATNLAVWSLFENLCVKLLNCVFIVDGLDECSKVNESSRFGEADGRLKFLEKLFYAVRGTSSRLLLVSRDDADVRLQINNHVDSEDFWVSEFEISREDTRADIETVSSTMIDRQLSNKTASLRLELASDVAQKCDGMFLWIRLLRSRLGRGKNAVQLKKAVADAPIGLNKAYEREIHDILGLEEDDRIRALRILRWIYYALRPLTVREISEALLVQHEQDAFPQDELPDSWDEDYVNDQIRRLCGSLVTLQGKASDQPLALHTVQYVHFSVKEFLSIIDHVASPSLAIGHEDIAIDCLRYLCYKDFQDIQPGRWPTIESRFTAYGFLRYAASSWYLHAERANTSEDLTQLIQALFDRSKSSWRFWSEVYESEGCPPELSNIAQDVEATDQLYYAALLGLRELTKELIDEGFDVNRLGGRLGCALQAAAYSGKTKIVDLLLQNGADPAIKCGAYISPITASQVRQSDKSSENILQLLAGKGAFDNLGDAEAGMALAFAAVNGGLGPLQALIDNGISPDVISTGSEETALSIAASLGNIEVAELLLHNGAEMAPENSTPPLFAAALRDRVEMMKFLLDRGAPLSGPTGLYRTTLNVSVEKGSLQAVELLLSRGADVTVRNFDGWTPLAAAARNGHLDIVNALLEKGAAVEMTDEIATSTAYVDHLQKLHASVVEILNKGQSLSKETVEADAWALLKASGVAIQDLEEEQTIGGKVPKLSKNIYNLSTAEARGWTALNAAAFNGHDEICSRLLEVGADINSTNSKGWTPLYSAARNGKANVVRLLLHRNADMFTEDSNGLQAIHAAARRSAEVVAALVEAGADPNILSAKGWTPLLIAASFGAAQTTRELLERGANIDVLSPDGATPLYLACTTADAKTVETLLDYGAEISRPNIDGALPLFYTVEKNHLDALKLILERGADVSATRNGDSLLLLAASHGFLGVAEVLLDYGANVDFQNSDGDTPLHFAAASSPAMTRMLLERGAAPNIANTCRETALLRACKAHSPLTARIIMDFGAELSPRDFLGKSAVDWAVSDPLLLTCLFAFWPEAEAYVKESQERWKEDTKTEEILIESALKTIEMMLERYTDPSVSLVATLSRLMIQLGRWEDAEDISALLFYFEDDPEEEALDHLEEMTDAEAEGQREHVEASGSTPRKVAVHLAVCDACLEVDGESPTIRGARFVCTSCANFDLCQRCMGQYSVITSLEKILHDGIRDTDDEAFIREHSGLSTDEELRALLNVMNRAKFMPGCIKHDFFELPSSSSFDYDGNFISPALLESDDALVERLQRLSQELKALAEDDSGQNESKATLVAGADSKEGLQDD